MEQRKSLVRFFALVLILAGLSFSLRHHSVAGIWAEISLGYFLPGLGRLVFNAIGQRDLPVVRDIVLFMAAAVVVVNFIVDLTYAALDPRIRLQ